MKFFFYFEYLRASRFISRAPRSIIGVSKHISRLWKMKKMHLQVQLRYRSTYKIKRKWLKNSHFLTFLIFLENIFQAHPKIIMKIQALSKQIKVLKFSNNFLFSKSPYIFCNSKTSSYKFKKVTPRTNHAKTIILSKCQFL